MYTLTPKLFYYMFHNGIVILHTKRILSVNYQLMTNIRVRKIRILKASNVMSTLFFNIFGLSIQIIRSHEWY
jgi:hypothetical protein